MKFDYTLLDVFTDRPLTGNPLAVVMATEGMLDDQMQRIAAEFNLSETVFITHPPLTGQHTATVRIFTPLVELPFAGHPTVGAAVVLGLELKHTALRLEEKIGMITCLVEKRDRRCAHARFSLPKLPESVGKAPEARVIARALGLDAEDIGCGHHQPSIYSAGVIFYLVPVKNAAVLKRIALNPLGWGEIFPLGHNSVYVYTETPEEQDNHFAARMFSPGMGLNEDPATGSAAAALIGELAAFLDDGQTEYVIRQGAEIDRPSRIHVQIHKANGELTHGGIGGDAVLIGQGCLELDD